MEYHAADRGLWEQEVPGSNPGAPIELTGFGGSDVRKSCSPIGPGTDLPVLLKSLSEPVLVRPLISVRSSARIYPGRWNVPIRC